MLRLYFILTVSFLINSEIFSQTFSANINNDSILIGNYFDISFECDDFNGEFEAPVFENCKIVSGPNTSMSTQIFNGVYSGSKKFSYKVKPTQEGQITIPPAYYITDDTTFQTQPIEINVYPNPEGIIQNPKSNQNEFFFDFFDTPIKEKQAPTQPKKPKRKLKRL